MKIYDSDGRLIHDVPDYQSGGFILPQYNPAQVTLQTPSNNNLLQATAATTNSEWDRYMQSEQVNAGKALNAQRFVTNIIDTKLKIQSQDRINKQLDLQNKKFEYQIMKDNLDIVKESLAMGSQEFLEGDRAAIDKAYEPINDKIANTDWRDTNAVFDNHRQKLIIKNSFKNAYTNKEAFVNGTKLIEENKNDKLIDEANKLGVLDWDVYDKYVTSKREWAKALSEFEKTGDRSILDKAQQHKQNIETNQAFMDSDAFKQKMQIAQETQKAKIESELAGAQLDKAKAKIATEMLPYDIEEAQANAELKRADAGLKKAEASIATESAKQFNSLWSEWLTKNPNATTDEKSDYFNKLRGKYGNKNGKTTADYTSAEQMYAEGYRTGDQDMMDAAMAWKMADNNKTTSVNYTTDSTGRQGVTNSSGITDWGGYRTKGNEFIDGSFGGVPVSLDNPAHKKLFEEGKIVFKNGKLRIKGNSVAKDLFGVSQSWGDFWEINDSVIKSSIPGIVKDGEYWEIPYDNKALPQGTNGTTGQQFFGGQQSAAPTQSNVVSKYYPK